MRKLLIIPWFGKFPNYFDLFLNSCSWNEGWNWLIFTDQNTSGYDIPNNVGFINTSFEAIRDRISKALSIELSKRTKPYKLCDFKPLYGFIFHSEILTFNGGGTSIGVIVI